MFVARFSYTRTLPVSRLYAAKRGLEQFADPQKFGLPEWIGKNPIHVAEEYFLRLMEREKERLEKYDYVLAAISANGLPFVDIYAFHQGNHDAFTFKDGKPVHEVTGIGSLIPFTAEKEQREKHKNVGAYIAHPPTHDGLALDLLL